MHGEEDPELTQGGCQPCVSMCAPSPAETEDL